MIKGDSEEYDLLEKWAKFDCQGHYSCEIGVRQGEVEEEETDDTPKQ